MSVSSSFVVFSVVVSHGSAITCGFVKIILSEFFLWLTQCTTYNICDCVSHAFVLPVQLLFVGLQLIVATGSEFWMTVERERSNGEDHTFFYVSVWPDSNRWILTVFICASLVLCCVYARVYFFFLPQFFDEFTEDTSVELKIRG